MKKQSNTSIEQVEINKLIPYAKNSRTHNEAQVAQIAASIREFGFNNPVLIGFDNDIIAGHGRVLAARKLGLEKVPCIRLDHLTDNQKRAFVIADNRIALNAGWDEEMLKIELSDLQENGVDMEILGFSTAELEMFTSIGQEMETLNNEDNNRTPSDNKEGLEDASVRQIILVYPLEEYSKVVDAMGEYAEKFGLSNNTEVLSHLLETNGYEINQRQEA
jgi:hypothetical protein